MVAEALFEALLEFDSILPKSSTLKEIHIIDVNSINLRSLQNILYCKFRQPQESERICCYQIIYMYHLIKHQYKIYNTHVKEFQGTRRKNDMRLIAGFLIDFIMDRQTNLITRHGGKLKCNGVTNYNSMFFNDKVHLYIYRPQI